MPAAAPLSATVSTDLALVLDAGVDDLDRRDDVFGGAQHFGETDAGPEQALAHDEASSTSTRGLQ